MPDTDIFHRIVESLNVSWDEHDETVRVERELEQKRRQAEIAKERRKALEAGEFPERAIAAALQAYETPAIAGARRFNEEASKCILVLSGGKGCGKTTAATWLAFSRRAPLFLRAADFVAAGHYDHELRSRWKRAGALVLDDLGVEWADVKGSFLTDLDNLLDHYYGAVRLLVMTTNLDATAFKRRYGGADGRILSRLREAGHWVNCGGDDLRTRQEESK